VKESKPAPLPAETHSASSGYAAYGPPRPPQPSSNYHSYDKDFGDRRNGHASALENEVVPLSAAPKIDYSMYDNIPVEVSGHGCPDPAERFADIELGRTLMENIKSIGYDKPTPVQKYSIPIVLAGRDLMACAQTGSGKTAAFLFPIISKLMGQNSQTVDYRTRMCYPSALILAPTRELACQIQEECQKFAQRTGLKSTVVYGGAPMGNQLWTLGAGCDILVATPGRLVDIIDRNKVGLSKVKFLVLDEADRMLDMGFEPQVRKIVEERDMPPKDNRRTLMFSATFPKEIQQLASSFLQDYIFLAVGRVGSATELVTQHFIKCDEHEKNDVLMKSIEDNPGLTLIFVEQKKTADIVDRFLQRKGYPSTSIHGDRVQRERTAAIKAFSTGQTPYLVATNVAARGLDIDNVAHVINYDMSKDVDDYVHRIGRTGRAGKRGISTTFITPADVGVLPKLMDILEDSGAEIPQWMNQMKFDRPRKPPRGPGHRFGGTDFRRDGGGRGGRGGGFSGRGRGGGFSDAGRGYVPPSHATTPATTAAAQAAPWNNQQYAQQAYQMWSNYGAQPYAYSGTGYQSYSAYPPPPPPSTTPTSYKQ